jgi:ring-1,2-phenylacetyl-CoA epoxidase subunit PaaC
MIDAPLPSTREPIIRLLLAMADDELMLGHRNSEWTGHAPILEEDIAFSNIAQDELGHSLAWYMLHEQLAGRTPDMMAFERPWQEFTCARFVTYPRGDFAYTVMRQYLFDEAEQVRLHALAASTWAPLRELAGKILREEAYHLLHVKGLVKRLGVATEESRRRMASAVATAYPQALGLFEPLAGEEGLSTAGVFPGMRSLSEEWTQRVHPVLESVELPAPSHPLADAGGRVRAHTPHLRALVEDLQMVYRTAPGAAW